MARQPGTETATVRALTSWEAQPAPSSEDTPHDHDQAHRHQLVILTQAAQHPRLALTIPPRLKGGTVSKVIGPLLAKGLVEEVEHAPDLPVYRTREDGSRMALFVTNAGLTAIGIEPEVQQAQAEAAAASKPTQGRKAGPRRGKGTDSAAAPKKARKTAQEAAKDAQPATRREGTKQAQLIAMLERKEGATIAQIVDATGWLPHTVRGAIAGALKKRLGLGVRSAEEGRGRVYRIG
jgi:DNA-binding MarR family transcriptional regulator